LCTGYNSFLLLVLYMVQNIVYIVSTDYIIKWNEVINMKIGYARVSTVGQSLETQIEKLTAAGCEPENIYKEKQTGTSTKHRKALAELKRTVREGDTVIVSKVDRLGRSLADLNKIVCELGGMGAQAAFIDENITFSGKGVAINKQVLNMSSPFAELEREINVQRTTEGRERALKRGQRFWRKISKAQRVAIDKALQMYDEREDKGYTVSYILDESGISRSTLYNELRKRGQ